MFARHLSLYGFVLSLALVLGSVGGGYWLGWTNGKAQAVAAAQKELAKKQVEEVKRANDMIRRERDRLLFEETINAGQRIAEGEAAADLGGGGLGVDRVRRLNAR